MNSNGRRAILPLPDTIEESAWARANVADKTILLTGAGGFIGSALAREIVTAQPRELLLLDHSEQSLYELGRTLATESQQRRRLLLGDVGDSALITTLLEEHRPDLLLHAAAYKHVPLMEANPFAAIHNNAILTWRLAELAAANGVPQFLLISTDKAANPLSILGVSKRIAELAVLRWSSPSRRYSAIRLVNVIGSTGSVVPLFLEQIARGGPLTVAHPEATRYFVTLADTVRLILIAAALHDTGVVFIPKLPEPVRILELAKEILRQSGPQAAREVSIEFTGLRPGDKLAEEILASGEILHPTSHPAFQAAVSPAIDVPSFDQHLLQLQQIVQRRDLSALLEALCRLVPEYTPGNSVCPAEPITHD